MEEDKKVSIKTVENIVNIVYRSFIEGGGILHTDLDYYKNNIRKEVIADLEEQGFYIDNNLTAATE